VEDEALFHASARVLHSAQRKNARFHSQNRVLKGRKSDAKNRLEVERDLVAF